MCSLWFVSFLYFVYLIIKQAVEVSDMLDEGLDEMTKDDLHRSYCSNCNQVKKNCECDVLKQYAEDNPDKYHGFDTRGSTLK